MSSLLRKRIYVPIIIALVAILILVSVPVLAADPVIPGTVVSNTLDGSVNVTEASEQVSLSWRKVGEADFYTTAMNLNLVVSSFTDIEVRAESVSGINGVLFVIDAREAGQAITGTEFTLVADPAGTPIPLGWDGTGMFYYFGPRTGFDMAPGYSVTTPIRVTANTAGNYTFSILTVQLP